MFTSVCLILAFVANEGKPAAQRDREPAQVVPIKPGPAAIEAPRFALSVQKDAKLPAGTRPDATAFLGDGRLAVSIQPERKSFPANGPVALTVTLKNVSEKAVRLYSVDSLGRSPKLVFVHLKSAGQVEVVGTEALPPGAASTGLAPGETVARTVVVESPQFVIQPQPVPRPVPLPAPILRPALQAAPEREAKAVEDKEPGIRRRPAIAPVALPSIAPQGTVRIKLFLEFSRPKDDANDPHWSGRIASEAIDVELTPPVFHGQPGIPIGGPITKEQAVTIAQQAAEGALNAAYQPVDGVRPPHAGPWISDPAKTAEVRELPNGGGWSVSWTHTPKGRGHSHHVKVDVTMTGQPTVREVFAGYSAAGK